MSDWRLWLFPPSRRDWGEAYLADFDSGSGLSRVVVHAWYLTIRHNPVMTVVVTSSVLAVLVGTHLAWLALVQQQPPVPPVVALVVFALVVQGGYTLVYMTGRLSPVEPLAASLLFAGQGAALLLSLSAFGTTAFGYVMWLQQAPVGPMAIRLLVATQAASTLYYFTLGRVSVISRNRRSAGGGDTSGDELVEGGKPRRLSQSFVATSLMIFGLLAVNLVATPNLRAMPWMIFLVVALPYTILSFVMVRRRKSPHLSTNVIRSLAYVAIPTLAVFFVLWRTLGDLGQAGLPGVVTLTGGAMTGALFLTLNDRRSEDKSQAGTSIHS